MTHCLANGAFAALLVTGCSCGEQPRAELSEEDQIRKENGRWCVMGPQMLWIE